MRYSDFEVRSANRLLRKAAGSDDRRIATAARKVLKDEVLFTEFLELRRQRQRKNSAAETKPWYQRWLFRRNSDAVAA